ncbi:hypothetical protein PMIN03_012852 [Paraphaeosphaeria minitans]
MDKAMDIPSPNCLLDAEGDVDSSFGETPKDNSADTQAADILCALGNPTVRQADENPSPTMELCLPEHTWASTASQTEEDVDEAMEPAPEPEGSEASRGMGSVTHESKYLACLLLAAKPLRDGPDLPISIYEADGPAESIIVGDNGDHPIVIDSDDEMGSDDESYSKMDAKKTITKYSHARERPFAYETLVNIAALVSHLGRKVDDAEKRDRYIMSHLGALDDRIDELRSECNENMDTIRKLQDEVNRLKRESNETEGVRAGQRGQGSRKRARRA